MNRAMAFHINFSFDDFNSPWLLVAFLVVVFIAGRVQSFYEHRPRNPEAPDPGSIRVGEEQNHKEQKSGELKSGEQNTEDPPEK